MVWDPRFPTPAEDLEGRVRQRLERSREGFGGDPVSALLGLVWILLVVVFRVLRLPARYILGRLVKERVTPDQRKRGVGDVSQDAASQIGKQTKR